MTSSPEGLEICAGKSDGNYANPKNPNSFYSCVHQSPIPQKCPSGLIFIEQLNRCEWINTTPRTSAAINLVHPSTSNQSPTTEKTTTSSKAITPIITSTIPASPTTGPDFCAEKSDGNYAHPTDQPYYYSCVNQKSVLRMCPSGLIFIEKANLCDWPPKANAQTNPTGLTQNNFCVGKSDGNYANPKNPYSFYSCVHQSPIPRMCPPFLVFIEQLNHCGWSTKTTASSTSTSATTTMLSTPTTSGNFGNPCGNKIGLIPDDNDPHYYFSCDGVKALRLSCPNDQVFDEFCRCCEDSHA